MMEEFTDSSVKLIEFPPCNEDKIIQGSSEISTTTDTRPIQIDKSVETTRACNSETQTEIPVSNAAATEIHKIDEFLKRVMPLMEEQLAKGVTKIFDYGLFDHTSDDDKDIKIYQTISFPHKEGFQGLAIWLSVYTNNFPVLVLTTYAAHDDWCQHDDQCIKVYVPKRLQSSSFISYQELKTIPIKACLNVLSTNPFDKNMFIGCTISGEMYVWKFVTNQSDCDVEQVLYYELQQGDVLALDWIDSNKLIVAHAQGKITLWKIDNLMYKEGNVFVDNKYHVAAEFTSILSISAMEFVVGCADGSLYQCVNRSNSFQKPDFEKIQLKGHRFPISNLFKFGESGKQLISCDIGGELVINNLANPDDDNTSEIIRIPLPFQVNVACSKNGKVLFWPAMDGSLEIYKIDSGLQTTIHGELQGKATLIKLSDNGAWIVTGLYNGNFQIFRIGE